jgi:hypothetical protein
MDDVSFLTGLLIDATREALILKALHDLTYAVNSPGVMLV